MQLAPFEEKMWESSPPKHSIESSIVTQTNVRLQERTEFVTEINREKLPSFVESLKSLIIWKRDHSTKEERVGLQR